MLSARKILIIFTLFSLLYAGCATDRGAGNAEKARALKGMGVSLILQGNLRAGLEQLLKAVELSPDDPDLHYEMAKVYYDLGEYQLSLEQFKKTLALRPDFSEALNSMGVLYVRMREWDLAISCFQKAANDILYKTPHYAYSNMGSVYLRKGDYQRAIKNYLEAVRIAPSYVVAYYDLASAYEAINSLEEAVSAYEKAVSLDPEFWSARFKLGKLYLSLDRPDDASAELEAVIGHDPRSPMAKEAKKLLEGIR